MNKSDKKWLVLKLTPKHLILVLRILFGLLFIFSGVTKIISLTEFEHAIKKFALIPDLYAPILSYIIPIAELVIGIFLILKIYLLGAVQFSIYLIIFFTSVVIVKVLEGGDLACGCFGALSSDNIDEWTVIRNLGLILWGFLILCLILRYSYNSVKKEKLKQKLKSFVLTTLIIFLTVQNAAFAIRNVELKNRVYRLIEKDFLSRGEQVEPFMVYKIDGSYENIFYEQSDKTVLFIMKYGCVTCKNNVPFWNEINKQFNSDRIRVLGISVDPIDTTKHMIAEYQMNFNVVYNTTEEFNRNFRIFMTPLTVIVNSKGIIEELWKGAIKTKSIPLIEKTLKNKH